MREFQQNSQSSVVHLEHLFSGSPGRPAFNIPREVLEMFVKNKFNVSAMASMLEVSESTVKRRLRKNGTSIFTQCANFN